MPNTETVPATEMPKTIAGYEYELPGGFIDKSGVVHKAVSIVEMTGQDEENISNPNVMRNGGRIITTLLSNCVKSLGGIKPTEEMIRNLLIGDRDFLMLRLRQVTLGEFVESQAKCPQCTKSFAIKVNLNDLEMKSSENPHQKYAFTLSKGYTDEQGEVHTEGEMRLPTGSEQEFLSSDAAGNRGAAATALLTRCCVRLGTLKAVSTNVIRALSFQDRQVMAKVMADNMPGPIMDLSYVCPTCSHEWVAPLSVADFFVAR